MAMESPPVRVEKRSRRDMVSGRLLSSTDEGERRRTRRWEVPVLEVEGSGRARSCVLRAVSAKAFSQHGDLFWNKILTVPLNLKLVEV